MLPYILAFISSFVFIGLKSAQQINVIHRHMWWIVPTSMAMAVCEVYVIATTAHNGWGILVLPIGLGGGLGSLFTTWMMNRKRPAEAPKEYIINYAPTINVGSRPTKKTVEEIVQKMNEKLVDQLQRDGSI